MARTLSNRQRFAARLRELRTEAGVSQERLAELAGVHRNYVGAIERGERNPGLDVICALADALDVDPGELVTRR